MQRRNRKKNYNNNQKNSRSNLPDIVRKNSGEPASVGKIDPPDLAVPSESTYGTTMPVLNKDLCKASEGLSIVVANVQGQVNRKKAIVFVDYEHWFYSMWEELGVRPNIAEWYGYISSNDLLDVRFYADFSKEDIFRELPRIRSFSSTVLDTRSPNSRTEKDYTDFILLNDMYRLALTTRGVEKVILLSGDGHFSPAVSFLKTMCGLEVEVYGVKGCISTSQRMAATILHELPGSLDYLLECAKNILSYIRKVKTKAPWYNFCFMPLAVQVSNCYGYDLEVVKDSIETLLRKGYLSRSPRLNKGKELNILEVDWDAVSRDGLTPRESRYASTGFSKGYAPDMYSGLSSFEKSACERVAAHGA